jgi:hypothetical protein
MTAAAEPQVLPQRPHLEIPGSQRLLYWAAFVAAVAIFGFMAKFKSEPIFAVCGLALMGACLWACLRALLPGATYLALDSDGLTVSVRFAKKIIQWADIKAIRIGWLGIETVQVPWNKQVFIDCRSRIDPVQIYPRMYGLNAEELVRLITPYYEDAKRANPNSAPTVQS